MHSLGITWGNHWQRCNRDAMLCRNGVGVVL